MNRLNNILAGTFTALLLSACGNVKDTGSLSDASLVAEFSNPSSEWRAKPFWSWNGDLDEKELLRQVEVFDTMGFGGYFMHSRVGLQTEYLGKEWFELTNAVADYGAARKMENYLYDEDRWPSGTAGGYVTQNPDYRMNFMTMKVCTPADFQWADSLTAVFSCKLDGTAFSDLKRLTASDQIASVPAGYSILAFFKEKAADTDFVNGYSYVDAMNREATDKFIELTHERYKKECGDRIGTTIKGIFFDEPHRGPLFTSFSNDNPNRPYMAPWTAKLPEVYAERFGRDIIDDLPYLFLHNNGAVYDKVKWQYCDVTQQLFLDNFVKPLYQWCDDNNMELTGHVLHENDFVSQVTMQGSLMRTYEFMHVPGIDVLTQGDRVYWIAKQLSSVARQTGKKFLLSELDGATGWQMTFQDYKEIGDWQALFGINLRCPHLSWYTMEGEAKRDYPASVSFQSGWYRDYKFVEDYYARLGLLLAQGTPDCGLLVINPIESVMAQVAVDTFDGLSPKSDVIADMQKKYNELFYWLEGNHIDFDYGDEEIMSRLASVGTNADGKPVMRVGDAEYTTVFVGNMATMRSSTLDLLRKFIDAGGAVVAAGELPTMVDVEPSLAASEVLSAANHVAYEEDAIVGAIRLSQPVMATVTDSKGNNISDIYCQVRNDNGRTTYVFVNMSPTETYADVSIVLPKSGNLSEWNCRDGKVYSVDGASVTSGGGTRIPTTFAPLDEHVYMVSDKAFDTLPATDRYKNVAAEENTDSRYNYTLNEPNVLPLDFALCSVDGRQLSAKPVEVLKVDRNIRRHFGLKYRGGEMLQPWFFAKFKGSDRTVYGNVELTFPFEVEAVPESDIYLCIETPERFSLTLNGEPVDAKPDGWWVDPCFKRIRIDRNRLREGRNTIAIASEFTEDLNYETLYLTGDFGVSVDVKPLAETTGASPRTHTNADGVLVANPRISRLPATLSVGDIVGQGLPFYSGVVSYEIPVKESATDVKVVMPDFVGACARLRHAGNDDSLLAFVPYSADMTQVDASEPMYVDVVLTRRNTFGPLHQLPARTWAYAPEMFVTEGDAFTEDYVLFKSGLFAEPSYAK